MGWETGNENAIEREREYCVFVSSSKGSFNGISELFDFNLHFFRVGTILPRFFYFFSRFYYFKPVPFQRILKGLFFVDTGQSVRVLSVLVWCCFGKKMMFREFCCYFAQSYVV